MGTSINERLNQLLEENNNLRTKLVNLSFAAGQMMGSASNLGLIAEEVAATHDSYEAKFRPALKQVVEAKIQLRKVVLDEL